MHDAVISSELEAITHDAVVETWGLVAISIELEAIMHDTAGGSIEDWLVMTAADDWRSREI